MPDRLVRCFIAVTLPAQIKKRLAAVQFRLKQHHLNLRWTDPSGFHLTLRFLGEIPPSDIGIVHQAMAVSASQISSFPLQITRLGVFPSFHNPRIVWAGIGDDMGSLKGLYTRLSESLNRSGLKGRKQKFFPHITLGRMKEPIRGRRLEPILSQVQIQGRTEFIVKKVHLYESVLTPSGAVHTIMGKADLQ